jgi:hypothetical protein
MEIYRDSTGAVTFEHPYAGITQVVVYDDSDLLSNPAVTPLATLTATDGLSQSAGVWTVNLPWTLTQFDRTLRLRWQDTVAAPNQFSRDTVVEVVTPIVSPKSIAALPSYINANLGPGDLAEVESKVRGAIQAFTRQNFGYFAGTKAIMGTGQPYLKLPQRLVEFDSLSGVGVNTTVQFSISGDGWYLTAPDYSIYEIKEAPPEEYQIFNQQLTDGVVRVPSAYSSFQGHVSYAVAGKWGYLNVPSPVREAALLLAEDYAAQDVVYRDRYVENISATDWTIDYNPLAYTGTGNARADALLEPYRGNLMEII